MKKVLFRFIIFIAISKLIITTSNAQSWQQIQNFSGAERDDATGFMIDNKAYCGTGLAVGWVTTKDFYRFDLETETWSAIPEMPINTERQYACGFSFNANGYVFGGTKNSALNDLWMYDSAQNSWVQKPSKPGLGLSGACSFVIGTKAYIVGGSMDSTSASKQVWSYNFVSEDWTRKNDFPFGGLWRASAATHNNAGYILFGKDSIGNYNNNLYKYNVVDDTWQQISTFPEVGRTYATMQIMYNNIVVFSGVDSLSNYSNNLWNYNIDSNTWHLQNVVMTTARKGGVSFCSGNKLYYTTGITQQNQRLNETWKIENPTFITESKGANSVKIFPNPSSDILNFEFDGNTFTRLKILDVLGNETLTENIIRNVNTSVDISHLSAGFYTVCISNNYRTEVLKFCIVK